jgi:predicted Zn-ribbon and HTH transcriptional regulator
MTLPSDEELEYRADHMTLEELEQITAETKFYSSVVKKLLSRGSKLIVGPRGVGKTHHMRIAYKQALSSPLKPFPVYITLSKYLRLEPLKTSTPIAIQYFHCWVLCKILLGIKDTLIELVEYNDPSIGETKIEWSEINLFCDQIEKQQKRDWQNKILDTISISMITNFIEDVLIISKRKHAILLCDDAALVLTKDYMIEFFDIFRALKSFQISPKASVYPNTEFGPRFHVGQDAESISCWPTITDEEYVQLFEKIYEKRYTGEIKDDVKKCFMYAAFGVPRAFINLINQHNLSSITNIQSKVNSVISGQAETILQEFKSLASKQPQYKNYVHTGYNILMKIISEMSSANKEALMEGKQQFFLGILQDNISNNKQSKDLSVIVRLLEETGLILREHPVKHGRTTSGTRVYERFIPHFTLLINEGAYQVGKSGYINNFSELINLPKEKHPLRKNSFADFTSKEEIQALSLDLPSCSNCGNPRRDEEQRFCMYCGSELINKSTFEELISKRVNELPLTDWLKQKIQVETHIETIADIILSTNAAQELRKAKGVGEKRASKVIQEASRLMDEFLS